MTQRLYVAYLVTNDVSTSIGMRFPVLVHEENGCRSSRLMKSWALWEAGSWGCSWSRSAVRTWGPSIRLSLLVRVGGCASNFSYKNCLCYPDSDIMHDKRKSACAWWSRTWQDNQAGTVGYCWGHVDRVPHVGWSLQLRSPLGVSTKWSRRPTSVRCSSLLLVVGQGAAKWEQKLSVLGLYLGRSSLDA